MSVENCLVTHKLNLEDGKLFNAIYNEQQAEGLKPSEAGRMAAYELEQLIYNEYLKLQENVKAKGGKLPLISKPKESKIQEYNGNKPNYKNKKTGELLYSNGEVSHLDQTTFINKFNESKKVISEKLDNYELITKSVPLANTDDVGGEMFGNKRQTGISLQDVKAEDN